MNRYRIDYRKGADVDTSRGIISAERVEGWRADYAFFANPEDLGEPTFLIPRDLVGGVSRLFDKEDYENAKDGGHGQPHQN